MRSSNRHIYSFAVDTEISLGLGRCSHTSMGLRRTSARCQILFLTFWLDWSQRLHWEVDILLVPGYVRSGLALIMGPSGDPRHIRPAVDTEGEMQECRHRWFSADHTGPVCGELGRQHRESSRFIRDDSGEAKGDIRHRGH